MISENQVLNSLSQYYEQAKNSGTAETFFLALYQFVEEYDSNPDLELFGKLIIEKQTSELALFNTLEEQVRKEMREVSGTIANFVATHNIVDEILVGQLSFLQRLLIESDISSISSLYGMLKDVLTLFPISGDLELNFLQQFATIDKKGEISQFTFIPSLEDWQREKDKIRNTKKARVWYAWFELVAFYRDHKPETRKKEKVALYRQYLDTVYNFTKHNVSFLHKEAVNQKQ